MGGMGGSMGGGIDAHDLFAQLFGNMGGGVGGMSGMSSSDEDDMTGFAGFGGFGPMRGGNRMRGARMGGMGDMGGMGSGLGHRGAQKEVVHKLSCTLDELYHGAHKKIKVTRNLTDASGSSIPAAKVLEVDVKPGWKKGTKVRFSGEGDELPDGTAQDIVFVLDEKPHGWFTRQGDDLHYTAKLSADQAHKGVKVTIPTLDGRKVKLETAADVKNGKVKRLSGEGMPSKNGGKGDLLVQFVVPSAA